MWGRRTLIMRNSMLARHLSVLGAYTLLTALMTFPLIINFTRALPGDGVDGWQFYWNLWWLDRALLQLHTNPFFTTDVYYPWGTNLYFHTLQFFPSLLVLPIVTAFGLTVAYNVIVSGGFVLSAYGMYALACYTLARAAGSDSRRFTRAAAFLAGVVFAFSGVHLIHLLGHLDFVSFEWLPFYVLYLFKSWREHGWRNPLLAAFFLAASALTSWYFGLYLLLFTVVFIAYHFFSQWRRSPLTPPLMRVGAALIAFAVLLSPLLVPMLMRGSAEGRVPDPSYDVLRFSADLFAFVVPSYMHSLWGERLIPLFLQLLRDGGEVEAVVFMGYIALLLITLSARTLWTRQRFWLMAFAFFAIMSLGPQLHIFGQTMTLFAQPISLPYRIFSRLPYADIPRDTSRIAVMSSLCLAVLAGYASMVVLRRVRGHIAARALPVLLVGGILFENVALPYPISVVSASPFYTQLQQETRAVAILEVPIPDDPGVYPRRMLYQTLYQKPSFQGYLSRGLSPLPFTGLPGFAQFKTLSPYVSDIIPYADADMPAISRAVLNDYHAGYVVIDKILLDPAQLQAARQVATSIFAGAAPDYEDDLLLAYRVAPWESPSASFIYLERGWYRLETAPPNAPIDVPARWRWMKPDARLSLSSARAGAARLTLRAWSFKQPRRLQVSLDDVVVGTFAVNPQIAVYETPELTLSPGVHLLRLQSLDGADVPGADQRALSFAFAEIALRQSAPRQTMNDTR